MASQFHHGTANRRPAGYREAQEIILSNPGDPADDRTAASLEAEIEWDICDGDWERYSAIVTPIRAETGGKGRTYRDALRETITAERAKIELEAERLAEAAEDAALWAEIDNLDFPLSEPDTEYPDFRGMVGL